MPKNPGPIDIDIDFTEWNRTLRAYLKASKKTIEEVLNTKAFFITLGAVRFTKAVPRQRIRSALWRSVNSRDRTRGKRKARRVYLIAQSRQSHRGQKGLYGAEMAAAVDRITRLREMGASYLRSGWLPALNILGRKVPSAARYRARVRGARQIGRAKGGAVAGVGRFGYSVTFFNTARPRDMKYRAKVMRFLREGLAKAWRKEMVGMQRHVEKKMQKTTNRFNA